MTSALYTNDRRADTDLPNAVYRLRFIEFRAADHLPAELAQELTAAIDEVVAALREKEVLP